MVNLPRVTGLYQQRTRPFLISWLYKNIPLFKRFFLQPLMPQFLISEFRNIIMESGINQASCPVKALYRRITVNPSQFLHHNIYLAKIEVRKTTRHFQVKSCIRPCNVVNYMGENQLGSRLPECITDRQNMFDSILTAVGLLKGD